MTLRGASFKPVFAWVTQGKTEHMVTIVDTKVLSMLNDHGGNSNSNTNKTSLLLSLPQDSKIIIKWQSTDAKQSVIVSSIKLMNLDHESKSIGGGRRSSRSNRGSRSTTPTIPVVVLPVPIPVLLEEDEEEEFEETAITPSMKMKMKKKKKKKRRDNNNNNNTRASANNNNNTDDNNNSIIVDSLLLSSSSSLKKKKKKRKRDNTNKEEIEIETELVDFDVHEVKKIKIKPPRRSSSSPSKSKSKSKQQQYNLDHDHKQQNQYQYQHKHKHQLHESDEVEEEEEERHNVQRLKSPSTSSSSSSSSSNSTKNGLFDDDKDDEEEDRKMSPKKKKKKKKKKSSESVSVSASDSVPTIRNICAWSDLIGGSSGGSGKEEGSSSSSSSKKKKNLKDDDNVLGLLGNSRKIVTHGSRNIIKNDNGITIGVDVDADVDINAKAITKAKAKEYTNNKEYDVQVKLTLSTTAAAAKAKATTKTKNIISQNNRPPPPPHIDDVESKTNKASSSAMAQIVIKKSKNKQHSSMILENVSTADEPVSSTNKSRIIATGKTTTAVTNNDGIGHQRDSNVSVSTKQQQHQRQTGNVEKDEASTTSTMTTTTTKGRTITTTKLANDNTNTSVQSIFASTTATAKTTDRKSTTSGDISVHSHSKKSTTATTLTKVTKQNNTEQQQQQQHQHQQLLLTIPRKKVKVASVNTQSNNDVHRSSLNPPTPSTPTATTMTFDGTKNATTTPSAVDLESLAIEEQQSKHFSPTKLAAQTSGAIIVPWTVEEDRQLIQLVKVHGSFKKWKKIARNIPGRKGKHCRERWLHNDFASNNPLLEAKEEEEGEEAVVRGRRDDGPKLVSRTKSSKKKHTEGTTGSSSALSLSQQQQKQKLSRKYSNESHNDSRQKKPPPSSYHQEKRLMLAGEVVATIPRKKSTTTTKQMVIDPNKKSVIVEIETTPKKKRRREHSSSIDTLPLPSSKKTKTTNVSETVGISSCKRAVQYAERPGTPTNNKAKSSVVVPGASFSKSDTNTNGKMATIEDSTIFSKKKKEILQNLNGSSSDGTPFITKKAKSTVVIPGVSFAETAEEVYTNNSSKNKAGINDMPITNQNKSVVTTADAATKQNINTPDRHLESNRDASLAVNNDRPTMNGNSNEPRADNGKGISLSTIDMKPGTISTKTKNRWDPKASSPAESAALLQSKSLVRSQCTSAHDNKDSIGKSKGNAAVSASGITTLEDHVKAGAGSSEKELSSKMITNRSEVETLLNCIEQLPDKDRKWIGSIFGSLEPKTKHLGDILRANSLSIRGTLKNLLESLIRARDDTHRKLPLKSFRDLVDVRWTQGPLNREWIRNLCGSLQDYGTPDKWHLKDILLANNLPTVGDIRELMQNLIDARDDPNRYIPLKSFRDVPYISWARSLIEQHKSIEDQQKQKDNATTTKDISGDILKASTVKSISFTESNGTAGNQNSKSQLNTLRIEKQHSDEERQKMINDDGNMNRLVVAIPKNMNRLAVKTPEKKRSSDSSIGRGTENKANKKDDGKVAKTTTSNVTNRNVEASIPKKKRFHEEESKGTSGKASRKDDSKGVKATVDSGISNRRTEKPIPSEDSGISNQRNERPTPQKRRRYVLDDSEEEDDDDNDGVSLPKRDVSDQKTASSVALTGRTEVPKARRKVSKDRIPIVRDMESNIIPNQKQASGETRVAVPDASSTCRILKKRKIPTDLSKGISQQINAQNVGQTIIDDTRMPKKKRRFIRDQAEKLMTEVKDKYHQATTKPGAVAPSKKLSTAKQMKIISHLTDINAKLKNYDDGVNESSTRLRKKARIANKLSRVKKERGVNITNWIKMKGVLAPSVGV